MMFTNGEIHVYTSTINIMQAKASHNKFKSYNKKSQYMVMVSVLKEVDPDLHGTH